MAEGHSMSRAAQGPCACDPQSQGARTINEISKSGFEVCLRLFELVCSMWASARKGVAWQGARAVCVCGESDAILHRRVEDGLAGGLTGLFPGLGEPALPSRCL